MVEIVDDRNRPVPPGTAGAKVLVTNLENRTLPLIRYELADRVIESPEPNPAGRPYRHLAGDRRPHGRHADLPRARRRDGRGAAAADGRAVRAAARGPPVPDRARAGPARGPAWCSTRQAPAGTPEQVRAAVAGVLEEAGAVPPRIDVTPVAELEREPGAAAKLKLIVSRAAG